MHGNTYNFGLFQYEISSKSVWSDWSHTTENILKWKIMLGRSLIKRRHFHIIHEVETGEPWTHLNLVHEDS